MNILNLKPAVFKNSESLTWVEAEEILSTYDLNDKKHVDHITCPLGSEVYIYFQEDSTKYQDWKVDGYQWKNNGNKKPTPRSEPVLFKSYYHIVDKFGKVSKEFTKSVYQLIKQPMPLLIHYSGINCTDLLKAYEPGPHKNIKNIESAEGYQKTLPSQLTKLKQDVRTSSPATIYKASTKHNGLRDLKQARNMRYAVNKAKRFTYDEIASCQLMHL